MPFYAVLIVDADVIDPLLLLEIFLLHRKEKTCIFFFFFFIVDCVLSLCLACRISSFRFSLSSLRFLLVVVALLPFTSLIPIRRRLHSIPVNFGARLHSTLLTLLISGNAGLFGCDGCDEVVSTDDNGDDDEDDDNSDKDFGVDSAPPAPTTVLIPPATAIDMNKVKTIVHIFTSFILIL